MASLVKTDKYVVISVSYPTTIKYFSVEYFSGDFASQEYATKYGQVSRESKLVVRVEYPIIMKSKINWY